MPPKGKGQGNGKGKNQGAQRQVNKPNLAKKHVAAPVAELPESLTIRSKNYGVPEPLKRDLPEFSAIQPYWSALEKLMPEYAGSTSLHTNCWTGLSGELFKGLIVDSESRFHGVLDLSGSSMPVFIKRIHLLEPVSAMEGSYVWPRNGALPAPSELWKTALAKINHPLNEAYVDAMFALCADRMIAAGISPHWVRCAGTFAARVDRYLYNITDEYESMKSEPWWKRNQRAGLFKVLKPDSTEEKAEERSASFCTTGIMDINADDFINVDEEGTSGDKDGAVEESEPAAECTESPVQLIAPSLRMKRLTPESAHDDDDSCSSTSEIQQFVELNDFPVQVTLLERADGTMDELLEEEDDTDSTMVSTKEERWSAWLFQVIAALCAAQHHYGFVHNDLHTNNIMWSGTGLTHLYYKIQKGKTVTMMKVPTYGRIMKIIDFGRATYTLPEPAGFFISDAFYPGNDAGSQYNCDPFYDPSEKKVEPNPSFDLARLAVSLVESLYPERPDAVKPITIMSREGAKLYTETVSPVYNLLWGWLQDDAGKNILHTPDGKERYPEFDLYRALAADVHNAIPREMVEKPLFQHYKVTDKHFHTDEPIYTLNI